MKLAIDDASFYVSTARVEEENVTDWLEDGIESLDVTVALRCTLQARVEWAFATAAALSWLLEPAPETLGQVARRAFEDSPGTYRQAWEAAASAVVAEHGRRRRGEM